MGTRGLIGFVTPSGEERLTYNHFDSYPDGVGAEILEWLHERMADGDAGHNIEARIAALGMQVGQIVLVDSSVEDGVIADAEIVERLKPWTDTRVGGRSPGVTWYQALRNTQGDLGAALRAGYMIDSHGFAMDSLFCEWGWVVDLEHDVFEAYRGFRAEPTTEGRWAGKFQEAAPHRTDNYHPIQRVAHWPLTALPTATEFIDAFAGADEEANA